MQALKGMDSDLGDRGTGLSSGQRQRIAIARALVQPRLLILMVTSFWTIIGGEIIDTLKTLRQGDGTAGSHQQAADAADRGVENGCVQEHRRVCGKVVRA